MAYDIHTVIFAQQFKIAVSGVQPAIEHLFDTDFASFISNAARGFFCPISGVTFHLDRYRFQCSVADPFPLKPYAFAASSA